MVELGPYVLQEPVARGGMAEVWRAIHAATDTPLAVKVSAVSDPTFVNALHGEASVMASFRSPYLVAVHDFGRIDAAASRASQGRLAEGAPWLAVEWVPHGTLDDLTLVKDWRTLRRALLDLLLGLAHAHARGVLHRDVKPENVLVAVRDPLRVKLADFGIAFAREQWLSGGARPTGALTPRYAAPEQVRSQLAAQGPWTDLYLVGCVAWALASGTAPFAERTSPRELMNAQLDAAFPPLAPRFEVPAGFREWLERLLQKSPRDRFRSAPHASDALLALERVTRPHRQHWSTDADPEHPPPRGTEDPGPGVFSNRKAPLVGRDAERDRLWRLLYDVSVDRRPRVVRVHGPSGVGTSALAAWLTERVLELGTATVATGAEGVEGGTLAGLVARSLGGSLRRPTDLSTSLAVHFGDDDPDREALLAWLSGASEPERSRRFALAARVLSRVELPAVVWVEGLAPGDLLGFARWVTDTRAFPALFVFTEADERSSEGRLTAGLALEDVPLEPLSPQVGVRLVLSFGAIEQATALRIADRAAGNPRLAVEILRTLAASGALHPSEAGWRLSRSAEVPAPRGPLAVAEQKVDEILARVPRSLPTLAVAAVLGTDGTVEEWELVCRRAKILIPPNLVPTLLRMRLLGPRGDTWAFTQPALVTALLARTKDRHAALHQHCAELLMARGDDPIRVGRHLFGAGREDEARTWLLKGLYGSADLVREGVCLELLDRLVPKDAIERAPILFKRIERARVTGRVDSALEAIRVLLALAKKHQDVHATARALMQRAVLRVEGGDDEGAVRDAQEAAELVERHGAVDPYTAQATDWLGLVLARTGRAREARAVLAPRDTYLSAYGLGMAELDEQHLPQALAAFERARTHLGPSERLNRALLKSATAEVLREQGRVDSAEELAQQALTELLDLQTSYVGDARVSLGFVHLAKARFALAEGVLRSATADNEDARRAAIAGLALATARQGRDPTAWVQLFDPAGLRMSLATDRVLARFLDGVAQTPAVAADTRRLAAQRAAAVLARCAAR